MNTTSFIFKQYIRQALLGCKAIENVLVIFA